jgi:hypothetical protein
MLPSWSIFALVPFAIAFVGVLIWRFYYPRFLIRLRGNDALAWNQIGRPPLRWYGFKVTPGFLKYLRQRRYEALTDATSVRLARLARFGLYAAYGGLGGFVIILGLGLWSKS